ncbi:MAG: PilT/PilU family type 4a pilus ATPase [Phycisphaerae bacterium]|nr:PilT/PilU family type 4a pilus ATPase [Phycisphaerae bacterium]
MQPLPENIIPLLEAMKRLNASDLHLKTSVPPVYRVAGGLRRADTVPFDPDKRQIEGLMKPIVPELKWQIFEKRGAVDFSFHLPDGDRFRINLMKSHDHMHAAIRRVKGEIPSFEELHLPPIYEKLSNETPEGMILVVGVTGSGKSSTMASMIDHINATRSEHIISIEDPVEYAFTPKKSIVSQREIGIDLDSFADGLRSAVRQDPDVIFVGEMRDKETVLAGVQAAETGHLVFGTLHTADTMQAVQRMLEFFPKEDQEFIRRSLANVLKAILAQKLLPATDPEISRVPACEVLVVEAAVREKIRNGEDEVIPALIASNTGQGMQTFNQALRNLVMSGMIYTDTAMEYAPNREQLEAALHGIETAAQTAVHRIKKH